MALKFRALEPQALPKPQRGAPSGDAASVLVQVSGPISCPSLRICGFVEGHQSSVCGIIINHPFAEPESQETAGARTGIEKQLLQAHESTSAEAGDSQRAAATEANEGHQPGTSSLVPPETECTEERRVLIRIRIPASSPMRQPALESPRGPDLGWSIVLLLMGPDPEGLQEPAIVHDRAEILVLSNRAWTELEYLWQSMVRASATEQRQQESPQQHQQQQQQQQDADLRAWQQSMAPLVRDLSGMLHSSHRLPALAQQLVDQMGVARITPTRPPPSPPEQQQRNAAASERLSEHDQLIPAGAQGQSAGGLQAAPAGEVLSRSSSSNGSFGSALSAEDNLQQPVADLSYILRPESRGSSVHDAVLDAIALAYQESEGRASLPGRQPTSVEAPEPRPAGLATLLSQILDLAMDILPVIDRVTDFLEGQRAMPGLSQLVGTCALVTEQHLRWTNEQLVAATSSPSDAWLPVTPGSYEPPQPPALPVLRWPPAIFLDFTHSPLNIMQRNLMNLGPEGPSATTQRLQALDPGEPSSIQGSPVPSRDQIPGRDEGLQVRASSMGRWGWMARLSRGYGQELVEQVRIAFVGFRQLDNQAFQESDEGLEQAYLDFLASQA